MTLPTWQAFLAEYRFVKSNTAQSGLPLASMANSVTGRAREKCPVEYCAASMAKAWRRFLSTLEGDIRALRSSLSSCLCKGERERTDKKDT